MRAVGWLVVLATAACLRPSTRTVTPVTLRAAVLGFDVDTLAPDRRAAVERGELWVGATAVEAYLARGRPVLWWRTPTEHGACDVLAHASLGDPSQPGFWVKTPLVQSETDGRIVNPANGKSAKVRLIPLGGAGGGSQVSLPALQLIGVSLTDLPLIEVYSG